MCNSILIKLMSGFTGQKIIFPQYHTVSNSGLPHLKHVLQLRNVAGFEKDLQFFLKLYKPLDANELIDSVDNEKRGFHITFDGAYAESIAVIAPILLKYGVPASFFISTAFVDNMDMMFRCKASIILERIHSSDLRNSVLSELSVVLHCNPTLPEIHQKILGINYHQRHILNISANILEISFEEYLKSQKPYLSTDQIKELAAHGFTIGSHSIDHPYYADVELNEQIRQTKDCLEFLHEIIDQKIKIFSFPFGDKGVKLEFFKEIQKEICPPLKLSFGRAGMKIDPVPFHFQRIAMEQYETSADNILLNHYSKYAVKASLFKNRIKRQ